MAKETKKDTGPKTLTVGSIKPVKDNKVILVPIVGSLSITAFADMRGTKRAQVWLGEYQFVDPITSIAEQLPDEVHEKITALLEAEAQERNMQLRRVPVTGIAYAGNGDRDRSRNGFTNGSFFAGINNNEKIAKFLGLAVPAFGARANSEDSDGGDSGGDDTPL